MENENPIFPTAKISNRFKAIVFSRTKSNYEFVFNQNNRKKPTINKHN